MDGISISATVAKNSDAELIRTCAEHIVNRDAFNEAGLDSNGAGKALWEAYMRTYDAISDARPQTQAGIVARPGHSGPR